jgi:hypothetical protein
MCPVCLSSALLIVASTTSGGGLAAVIGKKVAAVRALAGTRNVKPHTEVPAQSRKEVCYGTETRNAA